MRGSGGTEGGVFEFVIGLVMLVAGLWMFLDSINVSSYHGLISRYYGGSPVITMAPLALGIFILFFSYRSRLGLAVILIGIAIILLDVISGIRFVVHMRLWQWVIILVFVVGGGGLIARSFLPGSGKYR